MSHPGPAAVDGGSSAGGQSGVTLTSQMNGMITSQSRDSPERSPSPHPPPATAAAGLGGDVIKSSLPRPQDAVSSAGVSDTAQQNDIGVAAVDIHR